MYSNVPTMVPYCVNSGHRLAVVQRDHDVGRLDVAVNDALLVGVLDRLADRHKQLQPLARRQAVVVAVPGDRHAVDQLHDEIRPTVFGGPAVEDAGDVDMVHHGQRLPLGLEARDDLAAVHARLDDLERDLALHGLDLLGHEDRAHAAFADLLQELVRADHHAGILGQCGGIDGAHAARRFQERTDLGQVGEQPVHLAAQFGVAPARPGQVGVALGARRPLGSRQKDRFRAGCVGGHKCSQARRAQRSMRRLARRPASFS
jgi:hypothetical protein